MRSVLGLLTVGVAAVLGLALLLRWTRRRSDVDVAYTLSFSRGLDRRAIEAFVASLAGLRLPWWRRLASMPTVRLEVHADEDGIHHCLVVAERLQRRVEAALRTHVPSLRFTSETATPMPVVVTAAEYRLTTAHRQLRVEGELATSALLGSLAPLSDGEAVVVQWIVTPSAPPIVPTKGAVTAGPHGPREMTEADVAAAREKLKHPLFGGVLRIGVQAPTVTARRGLLRHVEAALHTTTAPGVHLRRRRLPGRLVARRLMRGLVPSTEWMAVTSHEITALLGWPYGTITAAGLTLAGTRPLALSDAVPTTGTIVGDGFARGAARPAALDLDARVRHTLCVGSTGTGKTTLLVEMALADIESGCGVLLIDPKGSDLVDGVLERLPERHHDRVVMLNPADAERPVGFNPLRPTGVDPDLAAEQVVGVAHRLWSQTWGVRSQDLIYAALRTLVADPGATLVDVLPVLTDPAFRRPLVDRTDDVVIRAFWRQYGALSDAEAATWCAPVANKFRQLIGRPGLRRIVGQAHPTLDVGDHLDHGGIVLVPLNTALVGEDSAALFGSLLLTQLWNVIQRRASRPATQRIPLSIFLDEFASYARTSIPMEELLAQARSYRVGVTLACQHLHQIEGELRHSVLSNPRTRIVFQVGAGDARTLATEFGQGLTPDDFTGLDAFQVVAQLYAAGRTQPAATITTRPPSPSLFDPVAIRLAARDRYGADGADVEESIRQRILDPSGTRIKPTTGSTGRKRRSS